MASKSIWLVGLVLTFAAICTEAFPNQVHNLAQLQSEGSSDHTSIELDALASHYILNSSAPINAPGHSSVVVTPDGLTLVEESGLEEEPWDPESLEDDQLVVSEDISDSRRSRRSRRSSRSRSSRISITPRRRRSLSLFTRRRRTPTTAVVRAVACVWADWMEWSECTVSCDGGDKERKRTRKIKPQNGGKECEGPPQESAECGMDECPTTETETTTTVAAGAQGANAAGGLKTGVLTTPPPKKKEDDNKKMMMMGAAAVVGVGVIGGGAFMFMGGKKGNAGGEWEGEEFDDQGMEETYAGPGDW